MSTSISPTTYTSGTATTMTITDTDTGVDLTNCSVLSVSFSPNSNPTMVEPWAFSSYSASSASQATLSVTPGGISPPKSRTLTPGTATVVLHVVGGGNIPIAAPVTLS